MKSLLAWVHQVFIGSSLEDLGEGYEAMQEQELYRDRAQQQDFLSATNRKYETEKRCPEVSVRVCPGN